MSIAVKKKKKIKPFTMAECRNTHLTRDEKIELIKQRWQQAKKRNHYHD